jgi:FERM, RhoGEF and pleckstrin domain protein 2
VSSINKSTESLNEKSASLSGSKNHRFGSIDNGSDGPRYDAFSNSDTEKFSSGTKSDDTTLTLTEMVQSITEWTTSSSATLVANVDLPQSIDFKKDGKRSSIDYVPLKPPKVVKKQSPSEIQKALPAVHSKPKSRQNTPPEGSDELRKIDDVKATSSSKSTERPIKIPPKVVEVHEKPTPHGKIRPHPPTQPPPAQPVPIHSAGAAVRQKRSSFEQMSQRYQSQDVQSESENFNEKLYTQTDKFSDRYQSQEFQPFVATPAPPVGTPTAVVKPLRDPNPFDKPLIKHHSYDDKTLSKSQIREYKTSKMKHSHSFHEHLVTNDLNKIDEENMGGSSSTTTTTTTTQNSENNTSTDNSSPMFVRPDKLIKCSPYYSSSLSSESPPIQVLQKPPRKGSITRSTSVPKSPPSGNDTDSSLDFRQQDPKFRTRGYRKRRQIPAKKSRFENVTLEHQESSECSEGYFPEIDSGSSESRMEYGEARYPDFEEEMEPLPEDYEDEKYKHGSSYPSTSYSTKFESFDMSENVDEMGFPKYDRLGHITNPMMYSSGQASGSSTGATPVPPAKPVRQKKKGLKREDSVVGKQFSQFDQTPYTPESGESGSGTETKAGLSDEICYSSEDSFAAAFAGYAATAKYVQNIEIPYPDFLSDYENEFEPSTTSSVRTMYEQNQHSSDNNLNELAAPPPMFAGDSDDHSEN